jgi:hypothetical protein
MTTTTQPRRHPRGEQPPEGAPRQARAATRMRGLTALMVKRPDLTGVYGPADIAAEAVRWSV